MIWVLALFAGFGLWRVTMVLRRGATDMSTGAILVVIGPLMAAPLMLLAWLGEERDVLHVPMEQAMFAGALGTMCVVLGVVLLGTGKKPAR
jgi:hypothetical protein